MVDLNGQMSNIIETVGFTHCTSGSHFEYITSLIVMEGELLFMSTDWKEGIALSAY